MHGGYQDAAVVRLKFRPARSKSGGSGLPRCLGLEYFGALRWWDWDAAKITRKARAVCRADVTALERAV